MRPPHAQNAPDPPRLARLRRYNVAMGLLHALQAAAVLILSNGFTLPVTGSFLTGPPGTPNADPDVLFDLPVGAAVACFLLLSSLFHFVVASPPFFERYAAGLRERRNYFRWVEYSLSASIMMVLIAMLTGITDVAALIAIFGVNASMIFFGLIQERYEQPGGSLLPFWLGSLVGIVPWIAVAVYLVSPGSSAEPPGFVYAIFVSLFIMFNVFAVNMWLQYRRIGRWRSYLFGESAFILLSLVSKSLLAWQVFGGTLAS